MPAAKFDHAVEDVARKSSLDRLRVCVTRVQAIAKDLLVAHERVLGAGLLMVARFPLPLASSNLANASDDSISRLS
jgi:hypothetical protein